MSYGPGPIVKIAMIDMINSCVLTLKALAIAQRKRALEREG